MYCVLLGPYHNILNHYLSIVFFKNLTTRLISLIGFGLSFYNKFVYLVFGLHYACITLHVSRSDSKCEYVARDLICGYLKQHQIR